MPALFSFLRLRLATLACVVSALAGGAAPTLAQTSPTLDELRTIHASREAALGGVRITETVVRTRSSNPTVCDREQRRLAENLELALERARRDHAEEGGRPEELRNVEVQIRQSHDLIAWGHNLGRTLNSGVTVRRTRLIDLVGNRIRWDDTDPRDLDQIVRDNHLTDSQRLNLDLSRIRILKSGSHWTASVTQRFGSRAPLGLLNMDAERIRLGIAPRAIFDPQYSATLTWPDGPDAPLITASVGTSTLRLTLDRTQGWSVVRYEVALSPGNQNLWVVNGFITRGDFRIPARITQTVQKNGVDDYTTETVQTQMVEIGVQTPDVSFELPADYRISDSPLPPNGS